MVQSEMVFVRIYGYKEQNAMRGKNQKLKLLYLAKIMQEQTDDTHGLYHASDYQRTRKV